jgi:integral membrane protein TerC family protein
MATLTSMLASSWLGMPVAIWLGFVTFVALLVAVDLGIFQRLSHEMGIRESFVLSSFFVALGLGFSVVVWWIYYCHDPSRIIDPTILEQGSAAGRAWSAAELFLTGLVIEQSLSLDNIFVISLVFGFFAVPRAYQHEVLFWGILGGDRLARDHDPGGSYPTRRGSLGSLPLCGLSCCYRPQNAGFER